jgi:hypothetical protein
MTPADLSTLKRQNPTWAWVYIDLEYMGEIYVGGEYAAAVPARGDDMGDEGEFSAQAILIERADGDWSDMGQYLDSATTTRIEQDAYEAATAMRQAVMNSDWLEAA